MSVHTDINTCCKSLKNQYLKVVFLGKRQLLVELYQEVARYVYSKKKDSLHPKFINDVLHVHSYLQMRAKGDAYS